ncbi:MAG: rhodanese-like domain-containing protein [Euryarchaeota archaeon]|nr:rhodanese-like domain-containing protein [Euryarchaeota archaeon]
MEKKKIIFGTLMFSLLLLILLSSSLAYAELTPPLPGAPNYVDTGVEKTHEMLEENPEQIILLDVRTEGEYDAEYIPRAVNIPLSDLENRIDELDMSKTIIVYCQSGGRSRTASEILTQHGFFVYNMVGGINAWKENFATSTSTPMPTDAVTPLPAVSPELTPAASPTPTASPETAPMSEEEREISGFEVIFALAAISLIVWRRIMRKQ